ncbi:hypothetical protein [Micromonospora sp. NPDC048830]|uniref:hypothetical protein n=1 Tax=Micromonospora sp. NPDC048830 TaxID=3364257 RepID=UPI003720659B
MRFPPVAASIDCADLLRAPDRRDEVTHRLAAEAVRLLTTTGFAVFRIGRLRLGVEESRGLALGLAEQVRRTLIDRGAPDRMRLEVDKPQQTYVPDGYQTRTLLPHHDGQHCSYLTPSLLDAPDWDPALREFGSSGYTTTPAHKMYQGIFLADPGEGLSVTTYYDWLAVIDGVVRARDLATGPDFAADPVAATARWFGANLRAMAERQPEHGCPYPSPGAMLGLAEPMWHGISFHHAENDLDAESRKRYPAAVPLAERCPCGRCTGPAARLYCHQTLAATGLNWTEFRDRWEVMAPGEHCDLLLGHNLTMLHGGLAGGPGRLLEPLCLVVDTPTGPEYERWLAAAWRRRLPEVG